MDYFYYLYVALAFLAVVLFLEGIYFIWRSYQGAEAKRIQKRLQEIAAGWNDTASASLIKQRLLSDSPALQKWLLKLPRVHAVDRLLLQSGMAIMVMPFLGYSLLTGLGGMALAALLGFSPIVIFLSMGAGSLIPYFFVLRAKHKRLNTIEQQLPEIIDLMSRALKAGHAFTGALQMAATEGTEPTAGEFRLVFDEINFGVPIQNALMNLASRVPITDLSYFVIAVLIQRESGGNLAELLDKISSLIRARLNLLGRIRVLSAEGKLSAWILSCIPFVMALILNIVNPGLMSVLWTDPIGPTIIAIALVMMLVGIYAMSRIIKIHV